jgi:hypothetical protein
MSAWRSARSGKATGMDVEAARERNQAKAQEEAERGPARSEPDAAPIADAIEAFHARGDLAFGIPAHRAGTGDVVPDLAALAGMDAFRADPGWCRVTRSSVPPKWSRGARPPAGGSREQKL